jgi:capsular exopolysaccharide synthesis family protein
MSIIEQALEKSRAAGQQRVRARRATDGDSAAQYAQQAAAIDPASRIRPLAVTVDLELCRERRLLLQNVDEKDNAAVAAYRILRTRLLHRARSKGWKTIAVTSAGPNDGKTLTTLNLAFSMAREKGREIVLLDLDMRNPSVCRALGVHPPSELADYLDRGEQVERLFFSVSSDNLLIAGSTTPTQNASELLASARFDELMRVVREGTVDSLVLIDLPPVLLTDDALVVAPKVDALLVVASEGVTGRSDLAKALHILSEFPIAGLVLNRSAESKPGYDYAYEYGYGSDDPGSANNKEV